jgi:(p)ppGpp synthase/HD superfamily hydrolase
LNHEYLTALAYATKAHGAQLRKGTNIPYITHPMGVASIVLDYGGTDTQAVAALLHDVVEDCGGAERLADVREVFGPKVSAVVELCSDSLAEHPNAKQDWRARKEMHLQYLRDNLTPTEAVVIAADKLHNLRAIRRDLRNSGLAAAFWSRFKGGESGTRWYYGEMISLLARIGVDYEIDPNAAIVWEIANECSRVLWHHAIERAR